ncbi:MAG: cytochrome c3 family protein [Candidatus Riflebacteria bacterium]|nr:cytochrome c3 family protein [Candidatus Riflebacteria bacterium]
MTLSLAPVGPVAAQAPAASVEPPRRQPWNTRVSGTDEQRSEIDLVSGYLGPKMRRSLDRVRGPDLPDTRSRASEVPPPQLSLPDLDPSRIPGAPGAGRAPRLVPEKAGAPIPRPDLPRPIDPLVARIFPTLRRATYIGTAGCLACHPALKDDWRRSIYGLIHYDRTIPEERRGCEGCHGPGSEHASSGSKEWIVNPMRLERRRIAKLCLSCHVEERSIGRQSWHFTDHYESWVSCVDCHSVHNPKAQKALAAEPNLLCYRCHREQEAYFSMTSHHPVKRERVDGLRSRSDGKVRCIDCHQAYSAKNPRNMKGSKRELCARCHAEFRGPFLFQHGGGSEELEDGCLTCHVAHGSPNRSLFRRPGRALCITCHTDRMAHNPSQSCFSAAGCHSDIHGSNRNRLFIRSM